MYKVQVFLLQESHFSTENFLVDLRDEAGTTYNTETKKYTAQFKF